MSSYRAIWTRFGPNFIFFEPTISDPGPKILLILVSKISDPGPKILILVQKISYPGPIKLFLLGGCRPPDPLLFLGGFQPPRPPWRGACSPPCPPAYREARPLGLSVFFWYRDLGTRILVPRSWYQDPRSWYRLITKKMWGL